MESTTPQDSPSEQATSLATSNSSLDQVDPSTATQITPLPSPTKLKATKEEIEAKRQAAMIKKQQREAAANSTRLANQRKYGRENLGAYGFTQDKGGGSTSYGNGSGGTTPKPPPTLVFNEATGNFDEVVVPPYIIDPRCTEEQRKVLEQVKAGKNVFFTGSAGVGKSFLLKEIRKMLEDEQRAYWVTASSGIAALQVEGTTTHSWAGLGLAQDCVSKLLMAARKKAEKWVTTKVLIIDEISMLGAQFFTRLNCIGKLMRQNNRAFGGIQIIVSGDFFQLPPVPDKFAKCPRCEGTDWKKWILPVDSSLPAFGYPSGVVEPKVWRCGIPDKNREGCGFEMSDVRFCFETQTWAECRFEIMELTTVFRQKDLEFVGILNQIRRGICTDEMIDLFKTYGGDLLNAGGIKPTNLYPLVAAVDKENRVEYEKLDGEEYRYQAMDNFIGENCPVDRAKGRLKDLPPTEFLKLKIGSQVLLLTNVDVSRGLVNGSRGVVVSFQPSDSPDIKPSQGGAEAWKVEAQSRFLKRCEGTPNAEGKKVTWLPEVFFASDTTSIIQPHTWAVDLDRTHSCGRTQIPLKLGWALTIHKSQGQSLDAVSVKLDRAFEKGQAYVALSRARTPAGMRVEGLTKASVMAHPTVTAFYKQIAEGLPFFSADVTPLNPLSYIPEDKHGYYNAAIWGMPPPPVKRSSLRTPDIILPSSPTVAGDDNDMMDFDYQSDMYSLTASATVSSASPTKRRQNHVEGSERVAEGTKDWQALLKSAVAQFQNSDEFVGVDTFDSPRFLAVAKQLLLDAVGPFAVNSKKLKPISASNPFINNSPTRPVASTSSFRAARTPSPTKASPTKASPAKGKSIAVRQDEDHSMSE